MPGVLAIVGRPNVGKSALFNRIAGRRIAIVHDLPGVTRDRVTAEVEWNGRPFTLIDTGGLGLRRGEKAQDAITQAAMEQASVAIESADAIILVVNVQEGLVPLDAEVAARLREAGKPVLLAANKSDNERVAAGAVDFASLGFDRLFPVSAIHGRGVEALMRAALDHLPEPGPDTASIRPAPAESDPSADPETAADRPRDPDAPLKLAIVGRPNVGKSSLINALTQSNRVVVSAVPGTTRDAVDVPFEIETEGRRERYVLVDTAGVRKRRSIDNSIEFFSVKRTEEAIGRCDIAILVLDAADGIREQDKKIGALITEARRACIVVVNKWDMVEENVREAREREMQRRESGVRKGRNTEMPMTTLGEFGRWVQEKLFFLDYAPVIFTSAASGFHLDRLLEAVRYVAAQLHQHVPTAVLNRTLHDAVTRRQPITPRGDRLKFYYATQIGQAPPRFVLFVNRNDILDRPYEKYLSGSLRTAFGYEGCPLVLILRARPKTIESVRKDRPAPKGRKVSSRPPARARSDRSARPAKPTRRGKIRGRR
ncbi:MAG: ribosome biogenesis GTPase Der [Verrucomicrobiae bacterium]|nr:ribosome biogenesis GTPase Der [Verrucomicrobiae bacterium]